MLRVPEVNIVAIDKFTLSMLRAKHNSVSNLKDRNFNARLQNDYNTELLAKYNNVTNTFKAIVQMSTYNYSIESRILDYQKVSIPYSAEVQIGDVLYWPRMKKNYLIFADRDTEKNYFLCYMSPADYEITWYDQFGNKQKQVASFIQTAKETIQTSENLYDYLDAGMQLLLKANAATDALSYYNRIYINDKNWEVIGKSTNTFPGMIALYLREVPFNKWKDVKDGLPSGSQVITTSVITSYDDISELTIGSTGILTLGTIINGNPISDTYEVTTTNCTFDKSTYTLMFSTLGTSTITITSNRSALSKVLTINVVEAAKETISYSLDGNEKVSEFLNYTYSAYKIINGVKNKFNVTWSVGNSKLVNITATTDNSCSIHMGNDTGVFTLNAISDGNVIASKEITIESAY